MVSYCFICGVVRAKKGDQKVVCFHAGKKSDAWQNVIMKPGLNSWSRLCERHFDPCDIVKGRTIQDVYYPYKMSFLRKGTVPKHFLGLPLNRTPSIPKKGASKLTGIELISENTNKENVNNQQPADVHPSSCEEAVLVSELGKSAPSQNSSATPPDSLDKGQPSASLATSASSTTRDNSQSSSPHVDFYIIVTPTPNSAQLGSNSLQSSRVPINYVHSDTNDSRNGVPSTSSNLNLISTESDPLRTDAVVVETACSLSSVKTKSDCKNCGTLQKCLNTETYRNLRLTQKMKMVRRQLKTSKERESRLKAKVKAKEEETCSLQEKIKQLKANQVDTLIKHLAPQKQRVIRTFIAQAKAVWSRGEESKGFGMRYDAEFIKDCLEL